MFIPIGDTPNPQKFTAWVNWSLIALNVIIFLFISLPLSSQPVDPTNPLLKEYLRIIAPTGDYSILALRQLLARTSAYDLFVFAHGFKPAAAEWGDLLFSLFLHANVAHLAGNMLFLWIYGDNVEHHLGRIGYLLTYLGTGVVATLTFALFAGDSFMPLVGASGAISGVLGLYFLLFPRNQVKLLIALFPFFVDVVLLPARWVLGFYIIFDNLLPVLTGADSNVAYGAHIGGFFAGLAIAWLGEHFAWQSPWSNTFSRLGRPAKQKPPASPPAEPISAPLSDVRQALAHNQPTRALQALGYLERRDLAQLSPNECVTLAGWLDDAGHAVAATRLLRGCLGNKAGADNLAEVYLVLGLMRLRQGQPTAAYQHLLNVFDYNPDPETAERARQALSHINIYQGRRK